MSSNMKYNILFVAAAAEPLTVKLESRSQSQLSSRWNTADFPCRYKYDTGDAQPHAKPLSMEGKTVTGTVTIGRLSVENQLSSLAVTFQRNWVKTQWVSKSTASWSVFSALKTFTPTLWNLVKPTQLHPVFSLFSALGITVWARYTRGIDTSKYVAN
ncbi:hypothetical protein DER44DRAFT_749406 [Fusarium oxysporum]|nr:hypothetical protein DER44DRAFT_749406 [Fusarium oxysporum]